MIHKKFSFITIVFFLTITGSPVALKSVTAQMEDKIEYTQIYDCGSGGSKFKVLSCNGMGKLDRCEVFFINEYSPGGGFKDTIYRSQVDDRINQGCKIKGRPAVKNEPDENEESENGRPVAKTNKNQNKTPPDNEGNSSVSCFASDPDSNGKTANEKTFRGVIRRVWEVEPEASGPPVTITFQQMTIGAPRGWRPTFDDAYAQADPSKPIYPVRTTFTTCSEYTDAITKVKRERIYDCYIHKAGGWQCTQTKGNNLKDEKEYIPQKRQ